MLTLIIIATSSAAKSIIIEAAGNAFFFKNGHYKEDITVLVKIQREMQSYTIKNIILDFIGIDNQLLMILFREALPDDDNIPNGVQAW